MRFIDFCVDRFGVLKKAELRDFSPALTVVYGGNGSGKTTAVQFLRGLLFGYTTDHQAYHEHDGRFGGSVSMESGGRFLRLSRERSHGISSDLSVIDSETGKPTATTLAALPSWINENVHREIFTVGDQEAARFDLLTRLCLDSQGASADEEIRRTELALRQSALERDGNGIDVGLRQKMTSLRRRREDLVREMSELQRANPEIPPRIARAEAELRQLRSSLVAIEQQITDVQAQIRRLEELLEGLRRQNVVALDRVAIEAQLQRLVQRQQRWSDIRQLIQKELTSLAHSAGHAFPCRDSLKSIRALVSRLEQRVDATHTDSAFRVQDAAFSNRDVIADHIRGEVFSLCDYVKRHESAIESHEASLEALVGQRALNDAENVDAVLQGQIDALKEELARSRDVLEGHRLQTVDCISAAHVGWRRVSAVSSGRSVAELEAELSQLRRRLEELRGEHARVSGRIRQLEIELVELKNLLRGTARLEDLDRLRAQIAEVDAQLALLENRHEVLDRTDAHLRTVIERLRDYRSPQVLDLASQYVNRLTDGDCYRLTASENGHQIVAETRQAGRGQTLAQLSRGTRDQVALALRLALIQCRADDADRCPLLLDDVFITADDDRAAAAADLLMEIARHGQQIIFFTCQKDVCELFRRRHAAIRSLDHTDIRTESRPLPLPMPPQAPMPLAILPPRPTIVLPPPLSQPLPTPPVQAMPVQTLPVRPVVREGTNLLFYLEVDNSVEDLSGLTVAEVEALRASGLQTIDDLLAPSVDELEACFRKHGYSIGRDRLRAWRSQAELATLVPMLRRSDAELLNAAGIQNTVELSRMRPETVLELVTRFQETANGQRYRRDGRSIDRQQAINWSRWSQHARSLSDARISRSRFFVKSTDAAPAAFLATQDNTGRVAGNGVHQRRMRTARNGNTTRLQRRPSLSTESRRERDERIRRRRARLSRHAASYRTTSRTTQVSDKPEKELRFYLNRSDDVEAAPTIGPRTAQRLSAVGIYTVDDLLNANARDIAAKLANRRITAETVIQWQDQARLVCQVPELRGHDAQILVACGVTDAEQLSQKRPADLYTLVGPFCNTSEGERIVRSGRKPDLEEVTEWIAYAQQARPLKVA